MRWQLHVMAVACRFRWRWLGAVVALWATFAPCFLWIFVGAPYIERLGENARLKAALTGVTAAVVGVILNLSVWFALHVLFASVNRAEFGPLTALDPRVGDTGDPCAGPVSGGVRGLAVGKTRNPADACHLRNVERCLVCRELIRSSWLPCVDSHLAHQRKPAASRLASVNREP